MTSRLASGQRGVILIQVGLAMVVLLGFCAFAVDYGVLWAARAEAQNSADAGALAAATTLAFDEMFDAQGFSSLAEENAVALASSATVWGVPPIVEATVCLDEACPRIPSFPKPEPRSASGATVSVYRDQDHGNALPTYFAKLFGVPGQSTRAEATAMVVPANVATCVWPLAIPDDWSDLNDADADLPLPPVCATANAPPCRTFGKYPYPGATVETADSYIPPNDDSEDFSPTGYQILQFDQPMRITGADPQIFVGPLVGQPDDPADPMRWRRINKRSLVPVQIGGGFDANLRSCNQQPLHVGDLVALETSANWNQATDAALELIAQDSAATWDSTAFRIGGSCASTGACGVISPRLVLLPMFDPDEYDRTRSGSPGCAGLPCIKIVNFVGFFLDSTTDANQIVGHLTTYPGKSIDINQPFVGYKWAFLRTAVLTR